MAVSLLGAPNIAGPVTRRINDGQPQPCWLWGVFRRPNHGNTAYWAVSVPVWIAGTVQRRIYLAEYIGKLDHTDIQPSFLLNFDYWDAVLQQCLRDRVLAGVLRCVHLVHRKWCSRVDDQRWVWGPIPPLKFPPGLYPRNPCIPAQGRDPSDLPAAD
ncbi:hypothetical protein FIBSPDRAFT_901020 [Athelia psychrophila]|uniref:Uncharacterized protein n=1 Tax=Athelia psychrophila TaxID=1759441 RepID=A0A165XQH1_9AGAM|nr:hypothetical protein FIBSPDRAFT_901020 [Fibularhizoctonia sp. CBS 109695]